MPVFYIIIVQMRFITLNGNRFRASACVPDPGLRPAASLWIPVTVFHMADQQA
jgi:hypothetical protein